MGVVRLCAFFLITVLGACGFGGDEIPKEILGKWQTRSVPRYEDFTIEITEDLLIFHNGLDVRDAQFITEWKTTRQDGKIHCEIYFRNEKDEESQVFLYYIPGENGGVIRIKNQDNIKWTRKDEF